MRTKLITVVAAALAVTACSSPTGPETTGGISGPETGTSSETTSHRGGDAADGTVIHAEEQAPFVAMGYNDGTTGDLVLHWFTAQTTPGETLRVEYTFEGDDTLGWVLAPPVGRIDGYVPTYDLGFSSMANPQAAPNIYIENGNVGAGTTSTLDTVAGGSFGLFQTVPVTW